MKKILSVLLCVTLVAVGVFAFAGCTKTSDLKYDVALITDGGSIHDKAYNQSAWDGVQTYANENSAKAVYYQPALEENQELTTDVVEQYVKLAVDKGAKYIVLPGETFAVICYELATMYPELHFVLLDAVPHSAGDKSARLLPNVMSASFDDLQSGYLAGFSAVLQGNTKLGYLGSVQNDHSSNYGAGFVQGAAAAADTLGVPVQLDYADYDSPLLDYDYSVTLTPVYKPIKEADKTCHKVVVENGNGSGTYKEGQNVTVSCDLFNEQGEKFDHWEVKSNTEGVKDKKVNVSSKKKAEINLIVEKCDCTLTAVYTKAEGSVGSVAVLKADKSATDKVYDNTVGEKVWVTAPAAAQGMVFDHWESTGNAENIENAKEQSTNVTVEENPVVLTPVYVVSTDPTFAVTVENGTGSGYYLPGDTVHITANVPKDGYYFDHWTNSDKDGNSAGLALESEYYHDTTFEMVDRYASIAESMIDKGDKALFAGGCDKSASLYTAKNTFDLTDVTVIGSGFNEEGAAYSVVKEYGTAAAACLKDFKGASIYNAGCANKAITCNLPDGEKKEELQKKLDAVYTQLGDGTIQPMAAAPGADVRKTFASNCLTLHYWILQSVKVSK